MSGLKRPHLKASLVFWNAEKKRFQMTTPMTSRAAMAKKEKGNLRVEAVFIPADTLDPRDAKSIAQFRECMADSEIGATFNFKGPVTFEMIQALMAK
jgi:hypothetical protein